MQQKGLLVLIILSCATGTILTTPSIHSQFRISTDELVFLRGGCHFGNPLLHPKLNCSTYDFIFYEEVAEMDTPYFGFS